MTVELTYEMKMSIYLKILHLGHSGLLWIYGFMFPQSNAFGKLY